MKSEILELIADGELKEALDSGGEFLGQMKDYYYSWTLLQSRFQDKTLENQKSILSQDDYTLEINKITSDVLELISKLVDTVKVNFKSQDNSEKSLKNRLQEAVIHSYDILDILSEGALTVTYKAKEKFEDDLIAIRVLKSNNLDYEAEAFNEINKIKRIQHRNIITVYGKSPKNITPKYVLMDYIHGIDIQSLVLESGPRPLQDVKRILLKICDALYYLHKRKTFNADLKTSRILMDREGEPMLSPFVVFRTKSENNYKQIVANLKYMSYQRLNSKDYLQHTPQSNQFSVGVIAYLLLTGEMLFDAKSIIDLMESRSAFEKDKKYREQKLSKIDAPEDVLKIVKRLLSPNSKDRFSSMFELLNAIKSIDISLYDYNTTAQESYLRACSYNPDIMSDLIIKIITEEEKETIDLQDIGFKLHNIIGLIIETNNHKNYLNKIKETPIYSKLIFNDFENFKEQLFILLTEYDYLWSEKIKIAWTETLNETQKILLNKKTKK